MSHNEAKDVHKFVSNICSIQRKSEYYQIKASTFLAQAAHSLKITALKGKSTKWLLRNRMTSVQGTKVSRKYDDCLSPKGRPNNDVVSFWKQKSQSPKNLAPCSMTPPSPSSGRYKEMFREDKRRYLPQTSDAGCY